MIDINNILKNPYLLYYIIIIIILITSIYIISNKTCSILNV
jgi:hypothetical protein